MDDNRIDTPCSEVPAYSPVMRSVRKAKFDPAKIPSHRMPVHLISTIPMEPSWQPFSKIRFHQYMNFSEPLISSPIAFTEE
jgi:hypothetical protein